MIIVENVLSISDKELLAGLMERIAKGKTPESNVVVFWQGEKTRSVSAKGGSASGGKEAGEMEKLLAKEKYATGFELLTGADLSKWIEQEIKSREGKISSSAAQFLAQNVGGDMWRLNSLVDQLVAYTSSPGRQTPLRSPLERGKGEEIQLADVQLFLEEKVDDNIFNMAEAVARGDRKMAFKLIGAQRRAGEDEGYVFSMILRQFRILVELRDLFEREDNATSEELAQKVGLHPFVVKKSLPMVKKYNLEKLKELYSRLLQIDIKTKTGQGGQSLLVDLFVGKLE